MINEPKYLIKSDVENVLKEWASKAWQDEWKPTHDSVRGDTFMEAMLIVNDMPPIDVQPVKRGHWYHNTSKYVSELDAYFIQACCSCCGRYSDRIDQYSQIMSNETCSHCGADMREHER